MALYWLEAAVCFALLSFFTLKVTLLNNIHPSDSTVFAVRVLRISKQYNNFAGLENTVYAFAYTISRFSSLDTYTAVPTFELEHLDFLLHFSLQCEQVLMNPNCLSGSFLEKIY
jgi:hypothetical protein